MSVRCVSLRPTRRCRTVIDVQDTGVAKLPQSVAEYFSSVVMIPIERFFVSQLAIVRNRSME